MVVIFLGGDGYSDYRKGHRAEARSENVLTETKG